MVVWLYRFIFGRLSIKFYGDFPEKALNLCAENGITLWNSKFKEGSIIANITVKDFYILRYILKGKGVRIHILHKSGLPFIINRYKRRPGLIIGAIVFIVILQILSGFVWVIDVEGNSSTKTEEILSTCEKIGIKTGMRVSDVHSKIQREKLLLELDSLSWAALNVEGSRLTINVTETKKEKKEEKKPCNLKAKSDGIIKKIDVTSGNSVVSVGDAVKKGDVLVSGIIERNTSTVFVPSYGRILAATQRSITKQSKFKVETEIPNGIIKKSNMLSIFNIDIPLYLGTGKRVGFVTAKKSRLNILGKPMPIILYTSQNEITEKIKITHSREELVDILSKQIDEEIDKMHLEEYTQTDINITEDENGVRVTKYYNCLENIAYQDTIIVNTVN